MKPHEFRPPEQELARFRGRLAVAVGLVLLAFVVLAGRFFYLQVIRHDYYHTRAEDNRISLLPIVPNRGLIVDRNGRLLARNYSAYTLEITPSRVRDVEETIDAVSQLIEIQPKDRKRFKKLLDESKNFESLPIRTRLTDEEVAKFVAQRYRFPGVDVKARLFRQYPEEQLASHVVGYIGRINEKELERIEESEDEANYRGTEHIGKTGLEQSYERELHGETGYEQVEVDAGGRAVRLLSRTPPVPGNNLVLTLDGKLQEVAEKAFGTRRGALVAIEPSTGGILALVSSPTFDPNLFVDGIDPQNWDLLNNSPDHPMINRALNGAYPPGSTFKPFMALGALYTRQAYRRSGDRRSRLLRLRRPPLPRRQGGRPRHGRYVQVDRRFLRHLLLPAGQRLGHRRHRLLHGAARFRCAHRRRSRRRVERHPSLAGVEAQALQEAGAAEVVCRRDRQHRHRTGLQRLHADSAGAGDRRAGQQRRDVQAAPGQVHRERQDRRKAH